MDVCRFDCVARFGPGQQLLPDESTPALRELRAGPRHNYERDHHGGRIFGDLGDQLETLCAADHVGNRTRPRAWRVIVAFGKHEVFENVTLPDRV